MVFGGHATVTPTGGISIQVQVRGSVVDERLVTGLIHFNVQIYPVVIDE